MEKVPELRLSFVAGLAIILFAGLCVLSSDTVWAAKGGIKGAPETKNNPSATEHKNPAANVHAITPPRSNHEIPRSARGQAVAALAKMKIHVGHYKQAQVYGETAESSKHVFKNYNEKRMAKNSYQTTESVQRLKQALEKIRVRTDNSGLLKLDPYGLVKDDRMELYGNRGRLVREEVPEPPPPVEPPVEEPPAEDPPAEEPPPVVEPPVEEPPEETYVTVTAATIFAIQLLPWSGEEITRQILADQGYTTIEIDFLLSQTLTTLKTAVNNGGTLLMP